ncbi:MAG: AAA family ATPase [Gammaproteobacteria bacterium]|nr:AAA family ATPase [Gammaproteobacteria bacterium]
MRGQAVNPAPSSPLIASLLKPDAYDHPVGTVELIETHISWVILTGNYAYKIKKPVDLGFVDFSTLAKRRHFCAEEVRLNRRLAPEFYLGVVPLTGSPDAPRVGGDGGAIEYAVKMRQFSPSAQLDRMLGRGELEGHHLDAFARLIADFHQRIPIAGVSLKHGEPEQVIAPAMENFPDLRQCLPDPVSAKCIAELERWTITTFARLRENFQRRKRDGFVCECHGDLHLRNLAWVNDGPLAFDCLEFNPDLRWIDVMNEAAFLVMDLEARHQSQLAARFLNLYLERTGDYAGLAVLPFYRVYRALVRAKVDGIRAQQPGTDEREKDLAEREARRYLALARHYTQPGRPRLILTRGVSASGKTTLSGTLVESLGAIRLRSDVERKRLSGLPAEADARAGVGQGIYDAAGSRRTYARLLDMASQVLDAGFPVVVDAAFLEASQRAPFRALAAARGIACTIVEAVAPPALLRERIANRARGASDAELAVLEHQLDTWQPLTLDEGAQAVRVDTAIPLDLDNLCARLAEHFRAGETSFPATAP